MKTNQMIVIASAIVLLMSAIFIYRSVSVRSQFDKAVAESLLTTEGYDQRFIDRVNKLEDLLATRAQFGYSGGKDPMTGTVRMVVQPTTMPIKNARKTAPVPGIVPNQVPVDPIRLTAIIGDATGKKITAIVMDGERSFSVNVGDVVAGRKITSITNDGIFMESSSSQYFYDVYGKVSIKSRVGNE